MSRRCRAYDYDRGPITSKSQVSGGNDMSSRCQKRGEKGFTLIELTISLTILVIVLVLSMSLLFSMKNFAQRQRQFAEPRQNARRAIDYVGSYIRAATDLNYKADNPNCIPVWVKDEGDNDVQVTYNNVQDANLAEPGSDILTIGYATNILNINITKWNPDSQPIAKASNLYVNFKDGCPNDALNLQLFKEITGACQPCANGAGCCSDVLQVYSDVDGSWTYLVITGFQQSTCSDANDEIIHVTCTPGQSDHVNPPSSKNVTKPCHIGGGLTYLAFRVQRTDPADPLTCELQQKRGMFDPSNPDLSFFGLLEGIEDLQIAYIYNDGTIWNDSAANLLPTTGNVPRQDGVGGGMPAHDVTNVMGMRVSVVSRANTPVPLMERAKFFRPASEDRAEDPNTDRFYHYRLTSTVMIRNRNLGS
ncbi:MAG TPA: prepilin-type N-terminal cleavage/methylation domain-containing protein [Acidobacteriota bacterium]|nr:prepilin-type N-terminal cleavage/methylation domain-containing protein [Acidobacteriota bacterium]HNT18139.1 prepilin-type N-terminal cleavage/methylation domain-containing protein [Acidobacteriota bacterium]HQO20420.1 prepilin-type N-terminal cleavage/methylation domain-containing protein [Acidobacteriota bacterium]HQQ47294.1 prepilin-type N-terminal cleavage/methylation domain-containing protein [Acidobacteriota bacterium]